MKRITVWKDVEVDIDATDLDHEDLLQVAESRGFELFDKDDPDHPENIKDSIFELYKDFLEFQGATDYRLVESMKKFFVKTINKYEI